MLDRLIYLCVRCAHILALSLPLSVAFWIARRGANVAFHFMRQRRAVALANLRLAFGTDLPEKEIKRIAAASFEHAAMSFLELFLIPKTYQNAIERIRPEGQENFHRAFLKKKGVIVAISHLGSWEYLSLYPYVHRISGAVIVRNIKNPWLHSKINDLRTLGGVKPILKSSSVRATFEELKKNHYVAILIDQWAGPEGVWTNFFGSPTSTTSIPARLAKTTGAPIIPMFCFRTSPGRYLIDFKEALEVDSSDENWESKTTEKLNQILEAEIRKYPEQWFWAHRRWKPKPVSLRYETP